jgi:hypothetical protein
MGENCLMLMMPLVVGEVEVNPGPPVEMENTEQILTKVRYKYWERVGTEKLLDYYKQVWTNEKRN